MLTFFFFIQLPFPLLSCLLSSACLKKERTHTPRRACHFFVGTASFLKSKRECVSMQ